MWVSSIQITDIKGFANAQMIELSPTINLLVGANNAGKSTVIKCLYRLQYSLAIQSIDVRKGNSQGLISLVLSGLEQGYYIPYDSDIFGYQRPAIANIYIKQLSESASEMALDLPQGYVSINSFSDTEPNNFIYPYSSKRKVAQLTQQINRGLADSVTDSLTNLIPKLDRICSSEHPANAEFREACDTIMGFQVGTFPSDHGKQAGLFVDGANYIPLESMGEGSSHLLGMITSLCEAHHKLYLIEEIENDIHPRALKALLRLIIEKSTDNQFVISTHSNIVTKYLGAEKGSKIFHVTMGIHDRLPTSICTEVGSSPAERRVVLEDLGYELDDFDLWKGWLFLEEASAERIIRDHLIRWFAPELQGRIRTIAATGITTVEPKFEDFNRLFLFTHLETMYRNRAWIVVDGDQPGIAVIEKLREKYEKSGWHMDHFRTFAKKDFEEYYPSRFYADVAKALNTPDAQVKRAAKKALLDTVLAWIGDNDEEAKSEFGKSAAEVIKLLEEIQSAIKG